MTEPEATAALAEKVPCTRTNRTRCWRNETRRRASVQLLASMPRRTRGELRRDPAECRAMNSASAQRVFKVATRAAWEDACRRGAFAGSADDRRDGFIHLSVEHQLAGTLARHFRGARDLVLVEFDAAALGSALRWEPSRGGDLFPHLYAELADGARGQRACARARRGRSANSSRGHLPMLTGPFDLAAGLMRLAPPEAAHEATLKSLELGLFPRAAAPDDPLAGAALRRPGAAQPGRDRRRLRQGRARARRGAGLGLRLRRGRHADAAAAERQSARRASSASLATAP